MKTRWISLVALLALALAACGQGNNISPLESQVPPSLDEPAATSENLSPNSTKIVEVLPLSTPSPDSTSKEDSMPNPTDPEIQKLIKTASEDLTKRFSIVPDQIQFKEMFEVVWPDSSLGCSKPDSSYLQVLTPGYLIRLQTLDKTFEYHTNKNSLVIYCDNPSLLPPDSLPDR